MIKNIRLRYTQGFLRGTVQAMLLLGGVLYDKK